jgi:hypothetical protein
LDDLSWSGFAEHFRSWILLNRREPFELGSGQHRLWLSLGGSAGHHGLWGVDIDEGTNNAAEGREWRVEVLNLSDIDEEQADRENREKADKQSKQVESDMKAIIGAMAKLNKEGDTKTAIRDATGINSRRFNTAFAQAIHDEHIVTATISKGNSRSYEAYKLKS